MDEVEAFISETIIKLLVEKAFTIAWDSLSKNVGIGFINLNKSEKFENLKGILRKLNDSNAKRERLLNDRNDQLKRYYELYANESNKLTIGNDIRIAYAHQLWLMPKIEGAIDPNKLRTIEGRPYNVDETVKIDGYKNEAFIFRMKNNPKKEPPYKGSTVRISDWNTHDEFTLSESNYHDQYVTNQRDIVDLKIKEIIEGSSIIISPKLLNKSMRELSMEQGKLLPFNRSPLANTIGIASTVITCDGYLIIPTRNKRVNFQSGYEGCSTSGVLEWESGLLENFIEELKKQISTQEGPEELLLDYEKIIVEPLAFAREFERAGKPQFFFHIWSFQRLEEFKRLWNKSEFVEEEFASIQWIEMYEPGMLAQPEKALDQIIERILALLSSKSLLKFGNNKKIILSEEMRANLFYLAIFLESNRVDSFPQEWIN